MTIFDTIRYPISDIPTDEQIANLPQYYLYSLRNAAGISVRINNDNIAMLLRIMLRQPANKKRTADAIRQIRKEIAEYDDI